MDEEFSVCEFYGSGPNAGYHQYIARWVTAETAMYRMRELIQNPPEHVHRAIITDGGDCCVFEWERLKGIVFPPELAS